MRHGMGVLVALIVVGCTPETLPSLDLTERLGPDEVRAGVVTDEEALFGGISAEGRVGDIKIYNDRVQFVIQSARRGSYYVSQGGTVIDADIVRPEGQLGRDAIDEWGTMFGLGRVMEPERVAVVDSGVFSDRAQVVAVGSETPMAVFTGLLEIPDLIPDAGLDLRTEYALQPGSWFLEARSTITATEVDVEISSGDIILGAVEVLDRWAPVQGLHGATGSGPWVSYVGKRNDIAVMLAPEVGTTFHGAPIDVVSELADLVSGFGPSVEIPFGESRSFVRYYGVGPDLATLTDALLEMQDADTDLVDGVVTAPDGPVAGARVAVLVDEDPFTVAVTDSEGRFQAQVPAGSTTATLAVGRGQRRFLGIPEGATHYSPYVADAVEKRVLEGLAEGAVVVPFAEGRGVGTEAAPLVLGEPGRLVLTADDGLPFEARLYRVDPVPQTDGRLVPGGPGGGAWAIGWARDGTTTLDLEPGTYTLRAHRGVRFERQHLEVVVEAGEETAVEVSLPVAYAHPGWLLADPHSHASPSPDGEIPMEERLVVTASLGLQLHFGTDHDHVADYTPLLEPLGLSDVLGSVISDEVSPLRGHMNIYPLEEVPSEPNNGAYLWWENIVADTATYFADLRARHGDIILQSNHPWSGLASVAGWRPGYIGSPENWSEDFDAVEVMNSGSTAGYGFYLDLVNRGILVTPVGVSDSHSHTGGGVGFSATFIGMGSDDPLDYTPDALLEAMRARRTIVTRGPFLAMSIDPGSVVVGTATLEVEALAPTWMHIDRLRLLRDGVEVDGVEGPEGEFALSPEQDASYVVIAEGDQGMGGVYNRTPWAMSSAILMDLDGDGWDPPLPPLELAED
ncbi:MAG: carboxypeptidase regulatory-like domain-containing protein [Deltaproteobacteria bacterium]|nr:carboxypeptidase regulatory-like domain-containing protein [Deltaproteobacteria bacterium]